MKVKTAFPTIDIDNNGYANQILRPRIDFKEAKDNNEDTKSILENINDLDQRIFLFERFEDPDCLSYSMDGILSTLDDSQIDELFETINSATFVSDSIYREMKYKICVDVLGIPLVEDVSSAGPTDDVSMSANSTGYDIEQASALVDSFKNMIDNDPNIVDREFMQRILNLWSEQRDDQGVLENPLDDSDIITLMNYSVVSVPNDYAFWSKMYDVIVDTKLNLPGNVADSVWNISSKMVHKLAKSDSSLVECNIASMLDIYGILEDFEYSLDDVLNESVATAAKDAARKAKAKITRQGRKLDDSVQRLVDDTRESRREKQYDKMVKNSVKATSILSKAIALAVAGAINPLAGILGLITMVAVHAKTKDKYKKQMIRTLDNEIAILDEKIEDARNEGNKQSKYKLLRTKQEIKESRDNIARDLGARG